MGNLPFELATLATLYDDIFLFHLLTNDMFIINEFDMRRSLVKFSWFWYGTVLMFGSVVLADDWLGLAS